MEATGIQTRLTAFVELRSSVVSLYLLRKQLKNGQNEKHRRISCRITQRT